MKKILFIITKSNWGGAQRYVFDLATGSKENRFDAVVAAGGAGELTVRLKTAGVRTIPVRNFRRDIRLGADIVAFFELLRIIRRERPCIVHGNSSKAGGAGALAARLAGVPRIVFTAHGWAFREPRAWWQKTLLWFASWLTALLAHCVIAVSDTDFRAAKRMPFVGKKIVLIHNGIAAPEFLSQSAARAALAEHAPALARVPANTLWLGTIAELHPNKGLPTAIKAAEMLARRGVPFVWTIVGAGEMRDALARDIAARELSGGVFLAGAIPDAARLLPAFDVFVLPSQKEGLPYTLIEAAFAGLPSVASAVGGIPEIVENEKTGLLVPPHDPHALADALQTLATDPAARRTLGAVARARAMQFSLSTMLHKTLSVYLPQNPPR